MPLSPPTLRGWAGRVAYTLIGRALGWYTAQLRDYQGLSSQAHAAEFQRLRRLSELVDRHELALNPGSRDLAGEFDPFPGDPASRPPAADPAPKRAAAQETNILDMIVTAPPSDLNAVNIFAGEWLSSMPSCRPDLPAGPVPLFEDGMVHWAIAELGGIQGQRILELGPLEGGHSYILQNLGAASVVPIESNTRAFLKCLIVKNLFDLDRVHYLCGNFIDYMQ